MGNKMILEAMASDLKRVSLGLQRGSLGMAKRFSEEALVRKRDLDMRMLDPYILNVLQHAQHTLETPPSERTAEDALMYSTILQNFVQKRLA